MAMQFRMQPGTLEVHLECASGLSISHFRIGSPYVIVSCGGGQQARSRTAIGQGLQPTFNEQFRFRVDGSNPEISITVFNQRTFAQDEELGSTRIPLANMFHGACPAKLPSTLYALTCASSGQHQGYLRLSLGFTPFSYQAQDGDNYQSSAPLQPPNNNGHDFNPRPYPPPTLQSTSHSSTSSVPGFEHVPYIPSFRSNQGRRPEAELREIASHAFTIRPVDWVRLMVKLDTADYVQMDTFFTPEEVKRLEDMTSQIPRQEVENLFMQFDASDFQRFQALQRLEAAKHPQPQPDPQVTAAEQLARDRRQIELLSQATILHDASTMQSAGGVDFMNAVGSDFSVEYSRGKPKKDHYNGSDFLSDI